MRRALRRAAPTERMRPVLARELLAEDETQGSHGPLRFADVLDVDLDLAHSGAWEELGGGDRVWRLRIESSGARSLAFVFKRFQLPAGGELYVYDDRHETVRGAYTELENRLDGEFALRPTRGSAITLEYYEPKRVRGLGELALALVVHDYRGVIDLIEPRSGSGTSASGACEIDVACPLGAPWHDQINAAVHAVVLPSGLLCTASLLNNTANDGTVLVLSAAHCSSMVNTVFTFNFERPACGSGTAPTTNVLTGATPLVFDDDLDVQLVRLNLPQSPTPFPVFAAGWDRSDVPPSSTVVIHHPAGDVKKISQDDDAPVIDGNFWRILDWEQGVTEGGSSGAPLFDPNGRFIGDLDSGASSCSFPLADDFCTRLAAVWSLVGPYLDPLGTGQLTLDGFDMSGAVAQPFNVTGVVPAQIEALDPGKKKRVRIVGSGMTDLTLVALDGVALDPARYVRGGHSWINVDMPQLTIGAHVFSLLENGVTKSVPFTIVPSPEPRLQVQDGEKGDPVFSGTGVDTGVDTLHADLPGHLHYCYWSLSPIPSVNPLLTLALGNHFTDLRACRIMPIPPAGWLKVHHALRVGALPPGTRVYTQSACVNHGLPLHTSNLQESEFQF